MLKDYITLKSLKNRYQTYKIPLEETVAFEEIQKDKVYKIEGSDIRIEFESVSEGEIWRVFFTNIEGKNEFGVVYRIHEGLYVARSVDSPNLEKEGVTNVNAALDLLVVLGEI